MSQLCPNCGMEIQSVAKQCPNCEHSFAPPSENKAAQEHLQSQETPEPEQEQPPLPNSEKTEQQVVLTAKEPGLDSRASLKALLPAVYTVGGILGMVMVLLVGAALPVAVVLISAAELLLKIMWLLAVGAIFTAVIVFFRAKTSTSVNRTTVACDAQHEQLPAQGVQNRRQEESRKTGERSSHDEEHMAPDKLRDYQGTPLLDGEEQDAEERHDKESSRGSRQP